MYASTHIYLIICIHVHIQCTIIHAYIQTTYACRYVHTYIYTSTYTYMYACKYACILCNKKLNFNTNLNNASASCLVVQVVPGSANTQFVCF